MRYNGQPHWCHSNCSYVSLFLLLHLSSHPFSLSLSSHPLYLPPLFYPISFSLSLLSLTPSVSPSVGQLYDGPGGIRGRQFLSRWLAEQQLPEGCGGGRQRRGCTRKNDYSFVRRPGERGAHTKDNQLLECAVVWLECCLSDSVVCQRWWVGVLLPAYSGVVVDKEWGFWLESGTCVCVCVCVWLPKDIHTV